jgi:protein-S-isoprenylcysteine O-methyltransferase Ste14
MTDRKQHSIPDSSRLPSLGPRGEGWVVLQVVAFVASGLAGLLGPAWDGPGRAVSSVAGIVAIGAGVLMAAAAGWTLGRALTPVPMPAADAVLRQTGPYALARHPIYGGIVLAAFGWGLLTASLGALIVAAAILVFFDLKSRREEAWLVERFPDYPAYRARTRRLLPWVY